MLQGEVYMYYGLSNYYQNHRLYVMSKDINQLAGGQMSADQLTTLLAKSNCYPYVGDTSRNVVYAPCGLIANSLFNGRRRGHLVSVTVSAFAYGPTVLNVFG